MLSLGNYFAFIQNDSGTSILDGKVVKK